MPSINEITSQRKRMPDENPALHKRIIALYDEAYKAKKDLGLFDYWAKYRQLYDKGFWSGVNRPNHLSRIEYNVFFESVETKIPVIAPKVPSPDITVRPSNESILKAQEIAEQVPPELRGIGEQAALDPALTAPGGQAGGVIPLDDNQGVEEQDISTQDAGQVAPA